MQELINALKEDVRCLHEDAHTQHWGYLESVAGRMERLIEEYEALLRFLDAESRIDHWTIHKDTAFQTMKDSELKETPKRKHRTLFNDGWKAAVRYLNHRARFTLGQWVGTDEKG